MTTPTPADLFFDTLVSAYVEGNPRFVRREWLAARVEQKLAEAGTRFVLITAEPGTGKSAFLAQLAHDHPDWPRYFIRRDQRSPLEDVDDKSLLLRVGYQLAALCPQLFTTDAIRVSVEQRIGTVADGGEVIGAEVRRLVASPFYQKVLEIEQRVKANGGKVVGLRVDQLVVEPRLLSIADIFNLAIVHPAAALGREKPDDRIVILIDALDEIRYHDIADGNILDWLTQCSELPPNVRFVLSSRPPDAALNLFRAKHAGDLAELAIAEDDPLVTDDIRCFVSALAVESAVAHALSAAAIAPSEFISGVSDKARGNLGYVGALARGIDASVSRHDVESLAALVKQKELPAELEGLYAFFLHQIKASKSVARERIEISDPETGETYDKPVWPAFYDRVLGVLAVAVEPVELDVLLRLAGIRTERAWAVDANDRLRQFFDVVDGRYRLYHATVAEFLTAAKTRDSADTADLFQDARRRHRQIADVYWSQRECWPQCDDYGLRNLSTHLNRGEQFDRLSELISDAWMNARVAREGYRYSGFLSDLAIASQRAAVLAADQADRGEEAFGAFAACFRYALIGGSANSLAVNFPPPLIERALDISLWPVDRAVDVASRVPDPLARAESYSAILESGTPLTDALQKEVCRAVLKSLNAVQTGSRVDVLRLLLPRLDAEQLRDALAIVRATPGPQDRADCLVVVARRLNGDQRKTAVEDALTAARESSDNAARARTYGALAGLVSEEARPAVLAEALAVATDTIEPRQRARAFVLVAHAMSGKAKASALSEGERAARGITDEHYRVEALAAIAAAHDDADEKAALLEGALAMARAAHDVDDKAWALWECMKRLDGDAKARAVGEAFDAARSIKDDRDRATILLALARHATGDTQATVLKEALAAARAIGDAREFFRARKGLLDRAMLLAGISELLGGEEKRSAIVDAVSAALASKDAAPRARALSALAIAVSGAAKIGVLEQALAEARAITDASEQARVLANVAVQFDEDRRGPLLQEALVAAIAVRSEFPRTWALMEILPKLSHDQLNGVLEAARAMDDADARAAVLALMVDRWTDQERIVVMPETLAAVRGYTDAKIRAATLASLTNYLEGDSRTAVLREAVTTAQAIESVQDRVVVCTSVILDKVSGDEKAALLKDTLTAARSIRDDEARVRTLVALSGMVNDEVRAGVWNDVSAGVQALESKLGGRPLAFLLGEPGLLSDEDRAKMLNDALAEAGSSADQGHRASLLTTIAPYLRDEKSIVAAEAAALTLEHPARRLDVLLSLGNAGDPASRLRQIRRSTVEAYNNPAGRFSETELLESIGSRMFRALNLGAQTVVSIAGHVVDIDRQWRWL